MDEFQERLAAFRQAMVDLDGDGIPDGQFAGEASYQAPPNALPSRPAEMRSYEPSTAEWLGDRFGDALSYLGVPNYLAQNYGNRAEEAAGLTGIPGVVDGGQNIYRGTRDGNLLQGAKGAGQVAVGAMPGGFAFRGGRKVIGKMFDSPMKSMGFAAGTTLPDAMLNARYAMAAQDDIKAETETKLRSMKPDELKAYQAMIGATPDGLFGPNTLQLAMQYDQKQKSQLKAEQELKAKSIEGDNAAKVEAARIRAEAEAEIAKQAAAEKAALEAKDREAKTPFRDLYPEIMPYMPVIAGVGAAGLGSMIRGSAGRVFNDEMRDLSNRWRQSVQSNNQPLANSLQSQFNTLKSRGPGGELPALGAGATFGAELSILPEEIDLWRGVPGAWERATNLESMGKRAAVGGLIGAGSAHMGARIRGDMQNRYHKGYQSETQAMGAPRPPAPSGPQSPGGNPPPPNSLMQKSSSRGKNQPPPDPSQPNGPGSGGSPQSSPPQSSPLGGETSPVPPASVSLPQVPPKPPKSPSGQGQSSRAQSLNKSFKKKIVSTFVENNGTISAKQLGEIAPNVPKNKLEEHSKKLTEAWKDLGPVNFKKAFKHFPGLSSIVGGSAVGASMMDYE